MDLLDEALVYLEWYKDPAKFYKDIFYEEPFPYQASCLRGFPKSKRHLVLAAAGCLAEGTKILVSDGTSVPIEKIKNGDSVYSFDPFQGVISNNVRKVWKNGKKEVIVLKNREAEIKVTKDHPILTSNGWKEAQDFTRLPSGRSSRLKSFFIKSLSSDKESSRISEEYTWSIEKKEILETYDLEMEDLSNYIAEGFVVHNTGKTKLFGGTGLWYATVLSKIERRPIEVVILSGGLTQAKRVYEYTKLGLQHPILSKRVSGEPRQSDTVMKDLSRIKAMPNSLQSVQGEHSDVVIVDEASLVSDFQLIDTYRIIGPKNGTLIWGGTPTVYDSLYVKNFEEDMRKKELGQPTEWTIWTWSSADCPNPEIQRLREEMRKITPEDMWQIFYEGKPYAMVGTVVPKESLLEATKGVTRFTYDSGLSTVFGVDWGWANPTALIVVQTDGLHYRVLEAFQWTQTDFEKIHDFIEQRAKKYSVQKIFCDLAFKGENLRLRKRGIPVIEVAFSKERDLMQSRMRDLFIKNLVNIPDEPEFRDLLNQLRVATWQKKEGEDLVDALMLSLKEFGAGKSSTDLFKIITGNPRKITTYGRGILR